MALFGEVWAVRPSWGIMALLARLEPKALPTSSVSLLGGYGLGVSPWLPDPPPCLLSTVVPPHHDRLLLLEL